MDITALMKRNKYKITLTTILFVLSEGLKRPSPRRIATTRRNAGVPINK
jgi:hypothetical protein